MYYKVTYSSGFSGEIKSCIVEAANPQHAMDIIRQDCVGVHSVISAREVKENTELAYSQCLEQTIK